MTLTRKQVNEIFGWVVEYAPRDPERIRQELEANYQERIGLCAELRDAARWHAQKAAYEAIAKHLRGKELSAEEDDAMGNICSRPFEDHEVEP